MTLLTVTVLRIRMTGLTSSQWIGTPSVPEIDCHLFHSCMSDMSYFLNGLAFNLFTLR